ncbi:hypothetical protein [Adlercreutzia wanghongyangiae]|uniref:hypothetical protein n=1 Tax=Adlercreutzia wanghongyangiae TaxID=3111451 RepID=UPI002DB63F79|nr:hypothetical protein [Adlercreutzia sp. R21]
MRFWEDSEKRLYTDEQLLRHIARYGSLDAALKHGDIRLASDSPQFSRGRSGQHRCLADYLKEEQRS